MLQPSKRTELCFINSSSTPRICILKSFPLNSFSILFNIQYLSKGVIKSNSNSLLVMVGRIPVRTILLSNFFAESEAFLSNVFNCFSTFEKASSFNSIGSKLISRLNKAISVVKCGSSISFKISADFFEGRQFSVTKQNSCSEPILVISLSNIPFSSIISRA